MSLATDIARIALDRPKFQAIVNGDAATTVATDGGVVPSLSRLLSQMGAGTIKGAWVTATAYVLGDVVTNGGTAYRCILAHTSAAALATDLAASRWIVHYTATSAVDTVAALKAAANTHGLMIVHGYAAAGDGGGGLFRWNASDTTADNGGSVIIPNTAPASGRWNRVEEVLNVKAFGATGDGVTNDGAAIMAAVAALPAAGGTILFPKGGTYRCNLDFSNNHKDVTFLAYGTTFKPFFSFSPIMYSDNTAFGAIAMRLEVIGATIDGDNLVDVCVRLIQTSGITLRKCLVQNAKVYGVYLNYGQYSKFIECVFTLCLTSSGSWGVYTTGPDDGHRSNELWFDRCQFFTNYNHCHIGGGEGCRFYACTFQDQRYIAGCVGALSIGADAAGNGSRKTTVDGCYFEVNKYLDVQIGVAESVTISNCVLYDANGYSGTKIASVYTNTLFDLTLLLCRFVTASVPTFVASHNFPVYRVIGCGVVPNVAGVTGANPYGYVEDTAQRRTFINGGFFSNGSLDLRRKSYPPKTLTNVNSAATDVATFTGLPAKYRVLRFFAFDASISLTTATVDLRTAAAGGGGAIVAAQALSPLTSAVKIADLTIAASTDYRTEATLYVRNVTAQGAAATCSFGLEVEDLT